jgi:hypothetical protein
MLPRIVLYLFNDGRSPRAFDRGFNARSHVLTLVFAFAQVAILSVHPLYGQSLNGTIINIKGDFPATGSQTHYKMDTHIEISGGRLTYQVNYPLTTRLGSSARSVRTAECNNKPTSVPQNITLSATVNGTVLRVIRTAHIAFPSRGPCANLTSSFTENFNINLAGRACHFSLSSRLAREGDYPLKTDIDINQQKCEVYLPQEVSLEPPSSDPSPGDVGNAKGCIAVAREGRSQLYHFQNTCTYGVTFVFTAMGIEHKPEADDTSVAARNATSAVYSYFGYVPTILWGCAIKSRGCSEQAGIEVKRRFNSQTSGSAK